MEEFREALAILAVRERQFHRFPFSIPALNNVLHQAAIVEKLSLNFQAGETRSQVEQSPANETHVEVYSSQDYYRNRDRRHTIFGRREY